MIAELHASDGLWRVKETNLDEPLSSSTGWAGLDHNKSTSNAGKEVAENAYGGEEDLHVEGLMPREDTAPEAAATPLSTSNTGKEVTENAHGSEEDLHVEGLMPSEDTAPEAAVTPLSKVHETNLSSSAGWAGKFSSNAGWAMQDQPATRAGHDQPTEKSNLNTRQEVTARAYGSERALHLDYGLPSEDAAPKATVTPHSGLLNTTTMSLAVNNGAVTTPGALEGGGGLYPRPPNSWGLKTMVRSNLSVVSHEPQCLTHSWWEKGIQREETLQTAGAVYPGYITPDGSCKDDYNIVHTQQSTVSNISMSRRHDELREQEGLNPSVEVFRHAASTRPTGSREAEVSSDAPITERVAGKSSTRALPHKAGYRHPWRKHARYRHVSWHERRVYRFPMDG